MARPFSTTFSIGRVREAKPRSPCGVWRCPSAFPSYSEALGAALRALPTEEVGVMVDHQPHGRMSAPEAELQAAR
jgi:hypothetical protein